MTRRAIDIEDETWRQIKAEAALLGWTVKRLVNLRLAAAGPWHTITTGLPHADVDGYCQRDGEPWPCLVATLAPDEMRIEP